VFIEQDVQLDVVHGVLKSIKYAGQNIQREADTHMHIIENIIYKIWFLYPTKFKNADVEMEKAAENIQKVDGRLQNLIKRSNTCCLWTYF